LFLQKVDALQLVRSPCIPIHAVTSTPYGSSFRKPRIMSAPDTKKSPIPTSFHLCFMWHLLPVPDILRISR
jgi:hypothetical protein